MAYVNGTFEATDRQSITFMNSEAARIESRVREEKLAKVRYPELLYVDTEAMDVGDDVLVTYVQRPGTGKMTPLAVGATDLPRVEVEYDQQTRTAKASGIAYGWDDQEVERAQKMQRNLSGDRIKAAYDVAEREKESVVLNGNTNYGWHGLITNRPTGSDAFSTVASASPWAAGNSRLAYSTIKQAFTKIYADTNQVFMPDTLLLPVSAGTFLFEPMEDSSGNSMVGMSVMSYLRTNNPYTAMTGNPLMIKMINELDKADSDSPMGLMYDSSEEVLRLIVAQDLTFTGPQRQAFNNMWYGRMKLGGVQIFHPKAFCTITGIGSAT